MRKLRTTAFAAWLLMAGCDSNSTTPSESNDKPEEPAATKKENPEAGPALTIQRSPSKAQPETTEESPNTKRISAAGIEFTPPPEWKQVEPANAMRKAQFELPGEAGPGELIIFSFGRRGAGTRDANVQRWKSQFTGEMEWLENTITNNGLEHTMVSASGTFAPRSMRPNAPAPEPKSDYAMDAVIVDGGPEGPLYIKAVGPKATIKAHNAALRAFHKSARLETSS